jgi:hypothetical protein
MSSQPSSLYACVEEANDRNESRWLAAFACAVRRYHPDLMGYDRWMLSLVLGTMLGYLYFRSTSVLVTLFLVYLVVEILVFAVFVYFTRNTMADIRMTHARGELVHLLDPFIFALSFFAAWYLVDYSLVHAGLGQHHVEKHRSWWRGIVVVSVAFALSGHWKISGWSFVIVLATIWLVHATSGIGHHHSAHYSLRVSECATGIVVFFYACFIRPIGRHYSNNAFAALLLFLILSSILHLILIQDHD